MIEYFYWLYLLMVKFIVGYVPEGSILANTFS